MQRLVIGRLLGVVADERHVCPWSFHGAASLGRDINLSIGGAYRADGCLAIFEADVQLLFRLDVLNRVELKRDVTSGIGM
jgi:hypothetical protein